MTLRQLRQTAVTVLAAGVALSPIPATWVEREYSTGLYLIGQRLITGISNTVPIALLDVLIAVAAVGWIAGIARDLRRPRGGWFRVAAAIAVRTLAAASLAYLAFVIVWGLNYRRVALAEKLQFQPDRVSPDGARALAAETVDRVNGLYDSAHAGRDDPAELAGAFARMQHDLGAVRLAVPGRPKFTLLDVYFRRAGVDAMTDPFFLETLVASDLLPFERPLVIAHEWSHLAGYADEGEANFAGWLTCLRGDDVDQYSGWLFLYAEAMASVPPSGRGDIAGRLAAGPRSDLRAIADRIRRHVNPRVAEAGWRVYDRYLKANRVEAGTASYAEVVRLALGVRFGPGWTPIRK